MFALEYFNVPSKDITSVALVVNTACKFDIFVWDRIRITPDVNSQTLYLKRDRIEERNDMIRNEITLVNA